MNRLEEAVEVCHFVPHFVSDTAYVELGRREKELGTLEPKALHVAPETRAGRSTEDTAQTMRRYAGGCGATLERQCVQRHAETARDCRGELGGSVRP